MHAACMSGWVWEGAATDRRKEGKGGRGVWVLTDSNIMRASAVPWRLHHIAARQQVVRFMCVRERTSLCPASPRSLHDPRGVEEADGEVGLGVGKVVRKVVPLAAHEVRAQHRHARELLVRKGVQAVVRHVCEKVQHPGPAARRARGNRGEGKREMGVGSGE